MRSFLMIVAAAASVACGVSNSEVGSDETNLTDDGSELSASSRTYVALRRDLRKCASPMCGGYYVHDVNRVTLSEMYVSGLDFSATALTDVEQGQVLSAGDGEVILRGKLGPKEHQFNTRPFIVTDAWRGLPGRTVATGASYFTVAPLKIQCFVAPCAMATATSLNHTTKTQLHEIEVSPSQLVDPAWLQDSLLQDGALAAGSIVKRPGGVSQMTVLAASQVFFKLPEEAGPCPLAKMPACGSGEVRTYVRDADRCIVPAACEAQFFCAAYVPACEAGYTHVSWTGSHGCTAYACDPTWLTE